MQVKSKEPRHHLQIEHLHAVGGVVSDLYGEPAPFVSGADEMPTQH